MTYFFLAQFCLIFVMILLFGDTPGATHHDR